jgi:hypothetical protein
MTTYNIEHQQITFAVDLDLVVRLVGVRGRIVSDLWKRSKEAPRARTYYHEQLTNLCGASLTPGNWKPGLYAWEGSIEINDGWTTGPMRSPIHPTITSSRGSATLLHEGGSLTEHP